MSRTSTGTTTPLPRTYVPLSGLTPPISHANVYGVVVRADPPKPSRGQDHVLVLTLGDPSCPSGVRVTCFRSTFPASFGPLAASHIEGTIVRVHNVFLSVSGNRYNVAACAESKGGSFIVIDGSVDAPIEVLWNSSQSDGRNNEPIDEDTVRELRRWAQNRDTSSITSSYSAAAVAIGSSSAPSIRVLSQQFRRALAELPHLNDRSFCDLFVKLVGIERTGDTAPVSALLVWDGTTIEHFDGCHSQGTQWLAALPTFGSVVPVYVSMGGRPQFPPHVLSSRWLQLRNVAVNQKDDAERMRVKFVVNSQRCELTPQQVAECEQRAERELQQAQSGLRGLPVKRPLTRCDHPTVSATCLTSLARPPLFAGKFRVFARVLSVHPSAVERCVHIWCARCQRASECRADGGEDQCEACGSAQFATLQFSLALHLADATGARLAYLGGWDAERFFRSVAKPTNLFRANGLADALRHCFASLTAPDAWIDIVLTVNTRVANEDADADMHDVHQSEQTIARIVDSELALAIDGPSTEMP